MTKLPDDLISERHNVQHSMGMRALTVESSQAAEEPRSLAAEQLGS